VCEPKNRVKGLFDILGNTYERREKHVFRVYVGALIPPLIGEGSAFKGNILARLRELM